MKWQSVATCCLIVLVGCVPSINPIYTGDTVVFDKSLLGTWQQKDSQDTWYFSRLEDKNYRLIFTDSQGNKGRFVAHVADVDGTRFLDLFPEKIADDAAGFYKFHLVPIHTVYLLKPADAGVRLAAIDYQWLEEFLKSDPHAVKHTRFDGRLLITASTSELQDFLIRHKDKFTEDFDLQKQEERS